MQTNFSNISSYTLSGKVVSIQGTSIKLEMPLTKLGDIIKIENGSSGVLAQVVSFNEKEIIASPMGSLRNISPGAKVSSFEGANSIFIRSDIAGSFLNALGEPVKSNTINFEESQIEKFLPVGQYSTFSSSKPVEERLPIKEKLHTGIRVIDAHTTLGKGQRIVILAEPGVGKSSLLLSLSENINVDLVVVALIGERGREVMEFYEDLSSSNAQNRTILVASTSDEPAPLRAQAAETAIRIAEIAASNGANVLLAFDSLTRYLRSLRDIGLSSGELPIRRGYPASVFEKIPNLIERAGNFEKGSITGVFTMLASSEMDEDPLVEEVKGLTDGHIILSRELAEQDQFPAVDIRKSLSRLQRRFYSSEEMKKISFIKSCYSELEESKDLLMVSGNLDLLKNNEIALLKIKNFLKQEADQFEDEEDLKIKIDTLFNELKS